MTNLIKEGHKGICLVAFDMTVILRKMCKWTNFSKLGQSVTIKPQSLLVVLYLRDILDYIWSFYRHIKRQCMQKIKADEAQERENMAFCSLQNT